MIIFCLGPPKHHAYALTVISHAKVHRFYYCPVPGCSRSKGGKSFKWKDEMIRHGLVHDSPGYVCPFCPDRDHKYPRPDNLRRYALRQESHHYQFHADILNRHVRVHHVDKSRDDPDLIKVLSQKIEGLPRRRKRKKSCGSV